MHQVNVWASVLGQRAAAVPHTPSHTAAHAAHAARHAARRVHGCGACRPPWLSHVESAATSAVARRASHAARCTYTSTVACAVAAYAAHAGAAAPQPSTMLNYYSMELSQSWEEAALLQPPPYAAPPPPSSSWPLLAVVSTRTDGAAAQWLNNFWNYQIFPEVQ